MGFDCHHGTRTGRSRGQWKDREGKSRGIQGSGRAECEVGVERASLRLPAQACNLSRQPSDRVAACVATAIHLHASSARPDGRSSHTYRARKGQVARPSMGGGGRGDSLSSKGCRGCAYVGMLESQWGVGQGRSIGAGRPAEAGRGGGTEQRALLLAHSDHGGEQRQRAVGVDTGTHDGMRCEVSTFF